MPMVFEGVLCLSSLIVLMGLFLQFAQRRLDAINKNHVIEFIKIVWIKKKLAHESCFTIIQIFSNVFITLKTCFFLLRT